MDLKNFFESKSFERIAIGVGIFFVALALFQAGTIVGARRAAFLYQGGDNYYRAFGPWNGGPIPTAHGATGFVVSTAFPFVIIHDQDGTEKTVVIRDGTLVTRGRDTVAPTAISEGDWVVVIGEPDTDADIDATLIRILPPPTP